MNQRNIILFLNIFTALALLSFLLSSYLVVNTSSLLKDLSTPSEEDLTTLSDEELENFTIIPLEEFLEIEETNKNSITYSKLSGIALFILILIRIGIHIRLKLCEKNNTIKDSII